MAYGGQFSLGRTIHSQSMATSYVRCPDFLVSNWFNLPIEVIRDQCVNQQVSSSSSRPLHIDGLSIGFPPTSHQDRRPLIASFDHPLRKRLREIKNYDLENLLCTGPHWINKAHLRSLYSAPKPWPSRDQSMSLETTHSSKQSHSGRALLLPKVKYNPGNTVGSSSLSIDSLFPFGRSVTSRIPSCSTQRSVLSSVPSLTQYPQQVLDKVNPRETDNKDEVLVNYCRWFDNLSSMVLESKIGESEFELARVNKSKIEGNYQGGLTKKLQADHIRLDLEKKKSLKHQDQMEESELMRTEGGISLIYCNKDENVDRSNNADKTGRGPEMENQNPPREKETILKLKHINDADKTKLENEGLSQTFQNPPREKETGLKVKHMISSSEPGSEKEDEPFVNKLVCMAKTYIESRRPQCSDNTMQCQKDSVGQQEEEETKTVQKEKRRKRIEVLKKLVAQQENKLAKLKRQANDILDDEELFNDSTVVKNKIRRQDI